MKRFIILLPFLIFLPLCVFAKGVEPTVKSIDESLRIINDVSFFNRTNPSEAIKRLEEIHLTSKMINYHDGMLQSGSLLMELYYRIGYYEKIIQLASHLEKEIDFDKSVRYYSVSRFYQILSLVYVELGFNKEGLKEYRNSVKYAKKIKDKDELHFSLAIIYKDLALCYEQHGSHSDSIGNYLFKSLKEIEHVKDTEKIVKYGGKMYIYSNIAAYYQKIAVPRDSALTKKYFLKAEYIYNTTSSPMLAMYEVEFLLLLSNFYLSEKKYTKAIELSKKCVEIEKKSPTHPYNRRSIYEIFAKSYLETGHKDLSREYMYLYTKLNDSLRLAERKSIQVPSNRIVEKNVSYSTWQVRKFLIIAGSLLILLCVFIFFKIKLKQKKVHDNYKVLIKQLKEKIYEHTVYDDDPQQAVPLKEKPLSKISDETANQLVLKLNKFEQSLHFLKNDVTLTSLANSLNTNPKYLSEIIKDSKGESFNSYINKLRITYVTNKLYEVSIYRRYKIKYLAEECGYSSPQVFVIAFKKQNGVTPSYFIEQLKKEFPDSI